MDAVKTQAIRTPKWHGEYFGLLDMVGLSEAWLSLASFQVRSATEMKIPLP